MAIKSVRLKPFSILPTDIRQWTKYLQDALDSVEQNLTTSDISDLTAAGQALITAATVAAQRTALGLGTAATQDTGTSGAKVPLLNAANTWSAAQTFGSVSATSMTATTISATNATFAHAPVLPTYSVSALPSAAGYARGLIYVNDETGGAVVAFSDGTDWRRVTDRAVVS